MPGRLTLPAQLRLRRKSDFDAAQTWSRKPDTGVSQASYYTVVMFSALDNKNFDELRSIFK